MNGERQQLLGGGMPPPQPQGFDLPTLIQICAMAQQLPEPNTELQSGIDNLQKAIGAMLSGFRTNAPINH